MKISPMGAELFCADGQMDRHMNKLIIAVHNFVNVPKNQSRFLLQ
jgi:hypothetical protein